MALEQVQPKSFSYSKGQWGWILFDWAIQPFFTVISTFIFIPYFVNYVIADSVQGTVWMGYFYAIVGIILCIFSFFISPILDYAKSRKFWIFLFTFICVISCMMLYKAVPGVTDDVIIEILFYFGIAAISIEIAITLNNSMLSSLTHEGQIGRLSSIGAAVGYAGGVISLLLLTYDDGIIIIRLINYFFEVGYREPGNIAGPFAAVWLLFFCMPLLFFTPDTKTQGHSFINSISLGIKSISSAFRNIKYYNNTLRFLFAHMLYYNGLNAILLLGGIYAASTLEWGIVELGMFGIILNMFSVFGSLYGAFTDDTKGSKFVIRVSIWGVVIGCIGVLSITKKSVLFCIPVDWSSDSSRILFSLPSEQMMLLFSGCIGAFIGPLQASSRALMARLTPQGREVQFFGLFFLSSKITSWVVPLGMAYVVLFFNSERVGFILPVVFMMMGYILLKSVQETRARNVSIDADFRCAPD